MNVPLKRILAALDRSTAAEDVFDRAIALAQQNNSHLILTHCISLKTLEQLSTLIDAGCGLVSSAKLQQLQDEHLNEINEAWQWLCSYALQAQAHSVCAEVRCETGEAKFQICHLAKQWHADLIVLGHGGTLSLKQKLFGSTTHHVVQHAPCSVIVVQPVSTTQHLPAFETLKGIRQTHQAKPPLVRSIWN